MLSRLLIVPTLVLAMPAIAAGVARQPVDDIKPLLVEAVVYGEAYGVLAGKYAEQMNAYFKTQHSMEIDVVAVSSLAQVGCKRLRVTARQKGVVEPKVKGLKQVDGPDDKTMVFEINFCENGRLPNLEGQ